MIKPSKNAVSLPFGSTKPPYSTANPHIGTDFRALPDYLVYKMEDGIMQCITWDGKTKEGNMIIETFGDLRFAHCHIERFLVPSGSFQKKGTPIAVMGYTGFVIPQGESGRHLHTTARKNGALVDLESLAFEKEENMPLTPTQVDKLIKMSLQREPFAEELNNKRYADNPGLLVDTLWNNGGKDRFENHMSSPVWRRL